MALMARGAWRRSLSDATFLLLLPVTVALLPWRWGFALLRRVARSPRVFTDVVDAAWQQARTCVAGMDVGQFKQRQRLYLLLDRCDSYLTVLHGHAWWQRHVDIQGEWPPPTGSVLLTAHWGSGQWLWRLLQAHGIAGHFLVRRADIADVGRGRLARLYLRWRRWALPRIGCRGPIYTGGSHADVQCALAAGDCVLGMLDLPVAAARRATRVAWLQQPARLPSGLAQLAVDAGAAVSVLVCGIDPANGRRQLRIESLPAGLDADALVSAYATRLNREILDEPAAWQLWSLLPAFRAGGNSAEWIK